MAIVYRGAGPWGAGKGGALTSAEGDGNIWHLMQAIDAIAADVPVANNVQSITQSGALLYFNMSNGDVHGPITLPVAPYVPGSVVTDSTTAIAPALASVNLMTECTHATGCTVTIPTNATVAFSVGTELHFVQAGSGPVTIAGASGVTINKRADREAFTDTTGAVISVKKIGTNLWRLFGDLAVT